MVANGSASLTYLIDGTIIGSSAANVYFTSQPNCSQGAVVRQTQDLGKSKTKTATYQVKDDNGDVIWSGNVTFDATKDCTSYELVY